MNGITSILKAGEIYEKICKMRQAITELNEALDAVEAELGDKHSAYKLLDEQRTIKFNELREFESQPFVPHSGVFTR